MILIAAELVIVFSPLHRVFAEPRDLPRDQQPRELKAGVAKANVRVGNLDDYVRRDASGVALTRRRPTLRFGLRFRRALRLPLVAAAGDEVVVEADAAVRPLNRTSVGRE